MFEVIEEVGQAHEKQFVVACSVGNLQETGSSCSIVVDGDALRIKEGCAYFHINNSCDGCLQARVGTRR